MLAELGYDGVYLSLSPDDMIKVAPKIGDTKRKYGLDVVAAYTSLDIASGPDKESASQVQTLFELLPDGCDLELSIVSSDGSFSPSSDAGDGRATEKLMPLLSMAERHHANICLYNHFGCWIERIEDCVRVCGKINHSRLKAVFSAFHWYAVDGKNLSQRVREAMPHLASVNICGTRREGKIAGCTIEPLDCGEMDNFALLGLLHKNGYSGRVCLLGYGIGGDAYGHLQRSLAAYRSMEDRLSLHPRWQEGVFT